MELISEREAEGDKHQNFQTALSVQKAPPSIRIVWILHNFRTTPSYEDSSMADVQESLAFDEVMNKDRCDGTKSGYRNQVKHFVQFLRQRNPDVVSDDGDVDVRRVTNDDLKAFFEHIAIKRKSVRRDGILSEPEDKVNGKYVLNSASYVEGYRSALKWYYETSGVPVPEEVLKDLSHFTSGFKRVKAKRKQDREEDADEGKSPMLFTAYEWLADKAMRATTEISSARFAWLFLLVVCNPITRSVNVGGLSFVRWVDDSLVMHWQFSKIQSQG